MAAAARTSPPAAAVAALLRRRPLLGPQTEKLALASCSSAFSLLAGARCFPAFPRPPRRSGGGGSAAAAPQLQDAGATVICLAGAYSLVSAFDALAERNLIEKSLTRKAVHVLSGLLYMFSWPIFSSSKEARFFAAIPPLVNGVRLVAYGLNLVSKEGLVNSMAREGKPEELLRGPLYYVLVLLLCALVFWRESPVGIVSLAMMCGGDGFADIIGRRFGRARLPYNNQKSWAGSISMFVFGFAFSIGMLYYFSAFGYIKFNLVQAAARIVIVSLVSTVVESLPISDVVDDNISVPLSSVVMAFVLFHCI